MCDRLTIRIHTQFNGHPSEVHTVLLAELDRPDKQALLRRLWNDSESFRPKKTSRDITEAAAKSFVTLADGLRKRGQDADEVAHFLTQCLFCFFAEDVGLLPDRMFEGLVNNKQLTSDKLTRGLTNLFTAMCDGGLYGNDDIPWFNGGLFKKVKVPALSIMEVTELRNAAGLNWSAIDVSIFGTLFERGLDPAKRSQLGAHYTDPATILRIIDPVLTRPFKQQWTLIAQEIMRLMSKSKQKKRAAYSSAGRHFKASAGDTSFQKAERLFHQWLTELSSYRVLDPACGSGNFLFMGLKALKNIEHKSHLDAAAMGLDREADLLTGPHNVLGIELNEYAAELARVTVWIGALQWRLAHGYEFKTNPVLEPLDHIECRDALLSFGVANLDSEPEALAEMGSDPDFAKRNSGSDPVSADHTIKAAQATEAPWPQANVVIGNPPFLGDKKMRSELGDDYTTTLRKTYEGRVPGGADLVCYWFEKARTAVETNGLSAAGLVATNSIRGGKNRKVLEAICDTTRIYEAWSDEARVNEGAAVRVSLVAFGHAKQGASLNGQSTEVINADLTMGNRDGSLVDLTTARRIPGNTFTCFEGIKKYGPFDVSGEIARTWLRSAGNPNLRPNSDVLRPWINATDVVRSNSDTWVIDFSGLSLDQAALYEKPFEFARLHVLPARAKDRNQKTRDQWWLYERPRIEMRKASSALLRFIVTPVVAKHRIFAWRRSPTLAMNLLDITARADDTTFGILHSRFHELWSLRMGTSLEDRPRYTPTTCFETFPFPAGLTPADTAQQRTEVLEGGAVIPAGLSDAEGGWGAGGSAQVKKEPAGEGWRAGDTEQNPLRASHPPHAHPAPDTRAKAIAIAQAAKKLNHLRETWLNPPEWTHKVPEVIPLGLDKSPYPDRIEPKPGISEHDLKALQKRTLTNLYNAKPTWLSVAHQQLDLAVANAYGWVDYRAEMSDDEILKRLLALNLARSNGS